MNPEHRSLALFSAVAIVSAGAALFIPLFGSLEILIISLGYVFLWIPFLIFCYGLYRQNRTGISKRWWIEHWKPTALVLLTTGWLLSVEPFMFKIINDELMIASTAQSMHLDRAAAVARFANWSSGPFNVFEAFLDKRPFLLPFLVSILHDLTGYRVANIFILNAILTLVFVAVSYWIVLRLTSRRGAYIFLLLIAFFPVLSQGATSGNASILNLTLLASALALAIRYGEKPTSGSLVPLVYCLILLAQSRYESIVYILPFGVFILMGWVQAKRIILSPAIILAPAFLIPVVLHQRYAMEFGKFYWQSGPENRHDTFSLSYLGKNLRETWEFLFHTGFTYPNSLILSITGVAGCLVILVALLRRRIDGLQRKVILLVISAMVLNTGIVLFFNYGLFTTYATSRLSLPLHLFLAILGAVALVKYPRETLRVILLLFVIVATIESQAFTRQFWIESGLFFCVGVGGVIGLLLFLLGPHQPRYSHILIAYLAVSFLFMVPKLRQKPYFHSYPFAPCVQYFMDFVKENQAMDTLFISPNPAPAILQMQNGIRPKDFFLRADLQKVLTEDHYRNLFYLFYERADLDDSEPINAGRKFLSLKNCKLELQKRERIKPHTYFNIYRVGLKEEAADPEKPKELPSN